MGREELNGRLVITVVSASNLPDCDTFSGLSDPYCIVKFDENEIGRTRVCEDEGSPVWNEKFYLNLQGSGENIIFELWDEDSARTDDLLAQLVVPISSIESRKSKKKKKKESGEKTVTEKLVGPDGSEAGEFTYSMSYREFGGKLESDASGNKKSFHVGINYLNLPVGKGRLNGCHNDVETLSTIISNYGFSADNARILRDDDENNMPTRANIEQGIAWLVEGAKAGDSLVFQFSGHGGQVPDTDGDEEDAKDETIIPCDYQSAGQITDDDLFKMLVKPLPEGVLLTAIMDCCHSGTGMDLAFIHKIGGKNRDGDKLHFDEFVEKKLKKEKGKKDKKDKKNKKDKKDKKNKKDKKSKKSKKSYDNSSDANVIMLSGCMDDQCSADAKIEGKSTGAMTYAFKTALDETSGDCTYGDLVSTMYNVLSKGGYSQVPQLSTARPFDLQSKFRI